jgi:hypothetical protein
MRINHLLAETQNKVVFEVIQYELEMMSIGFIYPIAGKLPHSAPV